MRTIVWMCGQVLPGDSALTKGLGKQPLLTRTLTAGTSLKPSAGTKPGQGGLEKIQQASSHFPTAALLLARRGGGVRNAVPLRGASEPE